MKVVKTKTYSVINMNRYISKRGGGGGGGGRAALVSAITANENHWLLLVKMIYHGWSKHHPQQATGLINT